MVFCSKRFVLIHPSWFQKRFHPTPPPPIVFYRYYSSKNNECILHYIVSSRTNVRIVDFLPEATTSQNNYDQKICAKSIMRDWNGMKRQSIISQRSFIVVCLPHTGRWANDGLMLGQHRGRWPNIKPPLAQRPLFVWFVWSRILHGVS